MDKSIKNTLEFLLKLFYFDKPNKEDQYEAKKKEQNMENNPPWVEIALKEIGTKEVPGEGNNPRIIEYDKATTLKATEDSTPWCSAFVCWCLESVGINSTQNAMARSYVEFGETLYTPKRGCIVVLWRGLITGKSGHVGFFMSQDDKYVYLLGGNQHNQVNITKFDKKRVISYRWPNELKT